MHWVRGTTRGGGHQGQNNQPRQDQTKTTMKNRAHLDSICGYGGCVSEVRDETDLPAAGDVRSVQPPREIELLPCCVFVKVRC